MSNLVATCMFRYKRTCGITRCSFAKCCGCIWSRISKKRISKPEAERLKRTAEMFYSCKVKMDESDIVLVRKE